MIVWHSMLLHCAMQTTLCQGVVQLPVWRFVAEIQLWITPANTSEEAKQSYKHFLVHTAACGCLTELLSSLCVAVTPRVAYAFLCTAAHHSSQPVTAPYRVPDAK
jgi:hypothetical protein